MKKLVEVQEVEGEGLLSLIGEVVEVWCLNYIYTGKLVGVNTNDILLDDCSIVYETGKVSEQGFSNKETFRGPRYIRTAVIESYAKVV